MSSQLLFLSCNILSNHHTFVIILYCLKWRILSDFSLRHVNWCEMNAKNSFTQLAVTVLAFMHETENIFGLKLYFSCWQYVQKVRKHLDCMGIKLLDTKTSLFQSRETFLAAEVLSIIICFFCWKVSLNRPFVKHSRLQIGLILLNFNLDALEQSIYMKNNWLARGMNLCSNIS